MWDETAPSYLAVARLTETGPAAAACRCAPDTPLEGFGLISGDGRQCRVALYIANLKPLWDRSHPGFFYYEGWLVGSTGTASLFALNGAGDGDSTGCVLRPPSELPLAEAHAIRLTAEPFGGSLQGDTPVLEGRLVWLSSPAAGDMPPDAVPAEPPAARAAEAYLLAAPEVEVEADPDGTTLPDHTTPSGDTTRPGDATLSPGAVLPADVSPPVVTLPPSHHPLAPLAVSLEARHPLAPRAAGIARLTFAEGRLSLTLRSLPTPAALGREPNTGRPYSGYRVWLLNQRTGVRQPLGLCQRIWGDSFRFESEGRLPLGRFDAVLVTAEDRTASPNPHAPQVMLGGYLPA